MPKIDAKLTHPVASERKAERERKRHREAVATAVVPQDISIVSRERKREKEKERNAEREAERDRDKEKRQKKRQRQDVDDDEYESIDLAEDSDLLLEADEEDLAVRRARSRRGEEKWSPLVKTSQRAPPKKRTVGRPVCSFAGMRIH